MNSRTRISGATRPRLEPAIGRRFSKNFATFLLLLMAAVFVAAACGGQSEDAAMFDEKGEPMSEEEATAAKTTAEAMLDSADQAPDFELVLFETPLHNAGETLRLSDLKGNPVVINFWFPSCPPCRAEMPDLEKVFQDHRNDGVEFVGVQLLGLDSAQDGQDFITEIGVSYAVGADGDSSITREYEIRGFPSTFFLDRDLRIVRQWTGPLNEEKLEELVQEVLP